MQRIDNHSKNENKKDITQDLPPPTKLSFYYESNRITPAILKAVIHTAGDIDIQIKEYLTHFSDMKDGDCLSGEDLFTLIEMIYALTQPEDNAFLSHPVL